MSTSMTCVVIIIALFYIWKTVNCQYYDYDYHEENEPKEEEEERHWEWDGQTDWRPESMKPQILDNFFNPFIEIQVEKEHNCTNVNCQRFYQPVCDSHGTIYKNPCWFNFHQCQKRGQGIYLMVAPCGYKQNEIVQHDDGASDCDKDGVLAEILSKLAVIRDGLEQKQAALASQSYSDDAIIVMSNIRSVTGKRSKNEIEFEEIKELFKSLIDMGVTKVTVTVIDLTCTSNSAVLRSKYQLLRQDVVMAAGRRLSLWRTSQNGWQNYMDYLLQE